jgi:hypothetical protein
MVAKFTNNSEIIFLGEQIQEDPDQNRFRGLEVNTIALEEASELSSKTYYKCVERCGTWIDKNWEIPCPSKIILSSNPDQGWVKDKFYTPYITKKIEAPYFYLQSKITDNPYIPKSYSDSLKELPKEIYDVFVEGSWDAVDSLHQLVSWGVIDSCAARKLSDNKNRYLGVDVGREGSDPTVLLTMEGGNIIDIEEHPKTRIDVVSDLVKKKMKEFRINAGCVTVDSVGVGGGVVDNLTREVINVIPMVGGATKEICASPGFNYTLEDLTFDTSLKFKNWKSYSYWVAAQKMKIGEIGNFTDYKLKTDAASIWYFTPNEKTIQVESKDDLKKRLGRSPDYWDAFTYAIWGQVAEKLMGESLFMTMSQFKKGNK